MAITRSKRRCTASSSFTCGICTESKPSKKSYAIKGCNHSYCSDCIRQYVTSKIQENLIRITCPVSGCYRSIKPEHCRSILPSKVFDEWQNKLHEAAIPARDKLYCPYKTCSALMIKGPNFKYMRKKKCNTCSKLFCTKCLVPWHYGITCGEFQNLHVDDREQEDIMLMQLAKNNKWIRCSNCKFFVEKITGCSHMRCRCGHTFCYNCGGPEWVDHNCIRT